jgi:hypothetical protein
VRRTAPTQDRDHKSIAQQAAKGAGFVLHQW